MTESAFAPIFPGWNVWQVWQVKDLPFSLWMLGVSRDRQLRIWVEDALRLNSSSDTADPLDLKGGQVEIIAGPEKLPIAARKEDVPGPSLLVSGPAELRTVRFFNHGAQSNIAWPHDESYLLDAVYQPMVGNPATSGPAPTTIGGTIGGGIVKPIGDIVGEIPWYVTGGAAALALYLFYQSTSGSARGVTRKAKQLGRRISRNL